MPYPAELLRKPTAIVLFVISVLGASSDNALAKGEDEGAGERAIEQSTPRETTNSDRVAFGKTLVCYGLFSAFLEWTEEGNVAEKQRDFIDQKAKSYDQLVDYVYNGKMVGNTDKSVAFYKKGAREYYLKKLAEVNFPRNEPEGKAVIEEANERSKIYRQVTECTITLGKILWLIQGK